MKPTVQDFELVDAVVRTVGDAEGAPLSMWHPEFGWVLVDGEPTDTAEAFLKKYGGAFE
jgi:hypothetical protein